ncbi:MAG: hypothetical protein K8R34_12575, partial [Methanosarcinales archaeon]|nr:hypothetical protein [Methanosarcinales archaeon]
SIKEVTNYMIGHLPQINLDQIIASYKRRWRIETGFRVQDEACIMSKSKDVSIRYFYFAYEQVLQMLWVA